MSACYLFRRQSCGFEVEAWDDGHSYILDDAGERHFLFLHPGYRIVINRITAKSEWAKGKSPAELEEEWPKHIGHVIDALCRQCGAVSVAEPEPGSACAVCGSGDVDDVLKLPGKPCPNCKNGRFPQEPEIRAIS